MLIKGLDLKKIKIKAPWTGSFISGLSAEEKGKPLLFHNLKTGIQFTILGKMDLTINQVSQKAS